jgi:hypothetical protein
MGELADEPDENFTAEYAGDLCIQISSSYALVDRDVSITYLELSFKWFLGLNSVLWKGPVIMLW